MPLVTKSPTSIPLAVRTSATSKVITAGSLPGSSTSTSPGTVPSSSGEPSLNHITGGNIESTGCHDRIVISILGCTLGFVLLTVSLVGIIFWRRRRAELKMFDQEAAIKPLTVTTLGEIVLKHSDPTLETDSSFPNHGAVYNELTARRNSQLPIEYQPSIFKLEARVVLTVTVNFDKKTGQHYLSDLQLYSLSQESRNNHDDAISPAEGSNVASQNSSSEYGSLTSRVRTCLQGYFQNNFESLQ